MPRWRALASAALAIAVTWTSDAAAEAESATVGQHDIPGGLEGYKAEVRPFFQTYCIRCHGPDKSKGKITLHTLDGDLARGTEPDRWEDILDVLDFEEMPPEDQKQPTAHERAAVTAWIDSGLRNYVEQASRDTPAPTSRRLTNFEYQNTMRDLLGIELNLADALPEDPEKPYHFNNSAEFMLLGPEQVATYLDNARQAMASAIVDPGRPEVVRRKWTFGPKSVFADSPPDEIGVYGGGRGSAAGGVHFEEWPETGEFRIRVKAAAILPPGFSEVPLRLVMGTQLRSDSGTGDFTPVGTVHLTNDVDHLEEFEFRGRIENHPVHVGKVTAGVQQPSRRYIYPQNLFDNGQLNDHLPNHLNKSWQYDVPRAVVRSIEFEAPVVDVWPPEHHTRILPDSELRHADPDKYIRTVLRRFASRAFRRPVTDDELDRFVRLYEMLQPEFGTLEATMRETLAMVLISPQFLYHTMPAEGTTTPGEALASRLSYFLWGSMPDERLLALAARNQLSDPEALETEALRMLDDPRARDFIDNFTTQWLSIRKMKAININRSLFPRFLFTVPNGERAGQEVLFRPTIRDHMHEETVGFIAELIRRNASALEIVDSDFAWLNEPLAAHYGVEGVRGLRFRAVPIKPAHRLGGLPTHGSVLVANSTGSAPHPIYRAVWLREAILGDEVKPPPADVPALSDTAGESADNASSIKEMLRIHRTRESCNDCHVRLDPWGIPFERYNAVGRFQPKVPKDGIVIRGFNKNVHKDLAGYQAYLGSTYTVAVEANAKVPHGPEIDGMRELKDYLLENLDDDIAENVLRRLLSYGLGRSLSYQDRYIVEDLFHQARRNDFRLRDMIISVCSSDLFRNGRPTGDSQP